METMIIDGRSYPRHPTFQPGRLTDPQRWRQMLQGVEFARKLCTTKERPLHLSLVQSEATIRKFLDAQGETQAPPDAPLPWET